MIVLKNRFYRVITVLMLIIWTFLTISSIFDIYPQFRNNLDLSFIVVIVVASVIFFVMCSFYRWINERSEKTHNLLAYGLVIFSFICLLAWGLTHKILPTYDLNHIVDEVYILINNKTHIIGENSYLSTYPQQAPLLILIYFVELLGVLLHIEPHVFMTIYNCLMISLTFLFIYKTLKLMFNSKVALIGLLLAIITPDFYFFAPYYYTDVLSIPFSVIGFYCLMRADKLNSKKKYILYALGGLLFAIGTKIRVVTAFLLIAYFINLILQTNVEGIKSYIKTIVQKLLPIGLTFMAFIICYSKIIEPYFKIEYNKDAILPATHWIMMGTNSEIDGGYLSEDVRYTQEADDKIKANFEMANNRLKKFNLKFFNNKLRRVWTQGDYDSVRKYTNVEKVRPTYKFLIGKGSIFIKYLQQGVKVVAFILFLLSIIMEVVKNKVQDSKHSSFIISILGAIVFYLLWEAQTRYSFSFLPWIILGGASSISIIDKIFKQKSIGIDNYKLNIVKFKKGFGILIILLTIALLADGFVEYSVRRKNYNFIRSSQYTTNKSIPLIKETLKHKFTISDNFNKIELIISHDNIEKEIDYIFELYDNEDNLLYESKINSSKALKNNYVSIKFPRQKVKKETTYYFKMYSEDATEDNYLSVATFVIDNCAEKDIYITNNGYDTNTMGETYINDKLICPELRIKIMDHKKSTLVSKKVYLSFSLIILAITCFSTYNILIRSKVKK